MRILSRWTTSHECEACDKHFCGAMAALVELDDGRQRIICQTCAKALSKAQEQLLAGKLAFLDRLHAGDPVLWGKLVILERKQELEEG